MNKTIVEKLISTFHLKKIYQDEKGKDRSVDIAVAINHRMKTYNITPLNQEKFVFKEGIVEDKKWELIVELMKEAIQLARNNLTTVDPTIDL